MCLEKRKNTNNMAYDWFGKGTTDGLTCVVPFPWPGLTLIWILGNVAALHFTFLK